LFQAKENCFFQKENSFLKQENFCVCKKTVACTRNFLNNSRTVNDLNTIIFHIKENPCCPLFFASGGKG
jgi:hypothetical protein